MLESLYLAFLALFGGTHIKPGPDGLVFNNRNGFDYVSVYDRFYADKNNGETDTMTRNRSYLVPYSKLDTLNINRVRTQTMGDVEWFEIWYDNGCWFYRRKANP